MSKNVEPGSNLSWGYFAAGALSEHAYMYPGNVDISAKVLGRIFSKFELEILTRDLDISDEIPTAETDGAKPSECTSAEHMRAFEKDEYAVMDGAIHCLKCGKRIGVAITGHDSAVQNTAEDSAVSPDTSPETDPEEAT